MSPVEFIEGYAVTCEGEVFNTKTKHIRKPQKRRKDANYLSTYIKGKNYCIHRLVAEAFVPNPYGHKEVRHIDSDPTNNHYKNLAWCTHKENIADALARRTHTSQTNAKFKQQQTVANKPSKARKKRKLPIGVSERVGARSIKYIAKMSSHAQGQVYLGSFDTVEEAFEVVRDWYFQQYGVYP